MEREERFEFLKKNKEPEVDPDTGEVIEKEPVEGPQRMNFIESYSTTQFKQANFYKEIVTAHNDYAEKNNSNVSASADFSDPNSILPNQFVANNPYIFFEKTQDGDFDLYQNLIELPKVSMNPLVSPLSINAFVNYKFSLNTIIVENGQKIYNINIEPRFGEAPLFAGNLYVIDSLWIIKSMDLTINPSAMNYFKDFRIIQDYEQVDGKWVPVRREFIYTINDGTSVVLANTRVNHTDYVFNLEFNDRSFKSLQMIYEDEAFDRDSAYWANVRPIKLKDEELEYIHEQDSINDVLTSDFYIDSVNTAYNKIRFWDVVLSGVGFRSREKKQEIYINSLLQQVQFITVGGYRHRFGGFYQKEFENAHKMRLTGEINYGFRNEDLKGELGVDYVYWPKHFGSFMVKGGDNYDFVTVEQSIVDFFGVSNQVRKTFIELSTRYEIINGLYGQIGFDHSVRRDITDLEYAPWVDTLVQRGVWNAPEPYETYTVSIFKLDLVYRFRQQYIIKGNKKLIIGTEFPELQLSYRKGVPGLFRSDVNFDHLEMRLSDEVQLATFGTLKWNVEAGTFFGKGLDEIQYVERKFIRGSDGLFFSNPLQTSQLLDGTFNTTRPYLQAYGIHHFNGAIMNKIPLINKLKLQLVGGASVILIQDQNYSHAEVYAGVERIFKIKQQLFKINTFYVARLNNTSALTFKLKIGLDFFNSFSNSWSY